MGGTMPLEQLAWDGSSKTRKDPRVYAAPDGADWWAVTQQVQEAQQAASQVVMLVAGQTLLAGQPVYLSEDAMRPAQAIDPLLADAWGFAASDGAEDDDVACTTNGQITLEDWTPIIGTPTLTPGATYYLHPLIAGMMMTTPPATPGQFVVALGKALSPLTFGVKIEAPIGL
jgi:hypothetical protein